ncbi:MAG: glycine dehydrogenase, partial [Bdellovibrionales bacterium]|nr:glycine dehydrogenase [Bdellovibrionales bacterium]
MNTAEKLELMNQIELNKEEQGELFETRHIGPGPKQKQEMLALLGYSDMESFISSVVPSAIRDNKGLTLSSFPDAQTEQEALLRIKSMMKKNVLNKSYIGMGYYGTFVPTVIQRNILENPGWYTQYTPYQPEISQGRLEALLNYQTMISDLTGLPIANSSLLDEGTAAAEAMSLSYAVKSKKTGSANVFYAASDCHPQTLAVLKTRAEAMSIDLKIVPADEISFDEHVCGVLFQYPNTFGVIKDYQALISSAKKHGALVVMACDLLSLALLKTPGELGADIALGSSQRFGVPMGYGGPHAAFFATKEEYKRIIPGRLVGVSIDSNGKPALRLALQTREQHIRREKATSNICTAQVLLAIMASMYAVYHGPKGIKRIATKVSNATQKLAAAIVASGSTLVSDNFFDTLAVKLGKGKNATSVIQSANKIGINLREIDESTVGISLDETICDQELSNLASLFGATISAASHGGIPENFKRRTTYLSHKVFNSYHSETEFLRYLRRLESRDLSLCTSMIPLGSCTMKLNATSEMLPVTWEEISTLHPFINRDQAIGYRTLFAELETALAEMTGFEAVSLQPNAGSQGEYAGLIAIRRFHQTNGDAHRNICL